jgi:sec-independent protein translocase protein TatC
MCLFASPMLFLYFFGVAIAWYVHPNRRNKGKEAAA